MFKTYLEISLGVSAAILLIFAFTPLIKRRYTAQWRYILWVITAVILIVPFKFNFVKQVEINMPVRDAMILTQSISAQSDIKETALVSEADTADAAELKEKVSDNTELKKSDAAEIEKENVAAAAQIVQKSTVPAELPITLAWLLGAILFMAYHIGGYIIFCRKIKPWCREIDVEGYNGKPRLMQCKIIKSPMLVGFIKPRILLPYFNKEETEFVLMHELTHYKRGDLWVKLLLITANAIHWFNPVIYIMRRAANKDMEYSCDETVVRNRDFNFKKAYSAAILHCAAGGMRTAFSTYFKEDKKNLKNRFSNILSRSRKKKGIIICCIICILLVIFAGAFSLSRSDSGKTEVASYEYNYLFLGLDGRGHTDAVMAVSLGEDKISVISIPRNSYPISQYTGLDVDDETISKIKNDVSAMLGININRYFAVDVDKAVELLSLLGEVEFEIPDLYGDNLGMVYDDPYQDLHISLAPGMHSLSADEMMQVIRYKKSNVNEYGAYMGYDNGDIGRIEMAYSLIGEIIEQKKDIISDSSILESVYNIASSAYTNMTVEDIKRIWNSVSQTSVEFSVLPGEYVDDVNGVEIYMPDAVRYGVDYFSEPFIDAVDTVNLSCQVTSFAIDGEEQIAEIKRTWGIWYNERLEKLHLVMIPQTKDGTFIIIHPYSEIVMDGEQAHGTFLFQITDKEEGGETLYQDTFEGTVTGFGENTFELSSADGRYVIKMDIVEE